MGLTDKLKDLGKKAEDTAVEHKDQIGEAVQKAAATADQRTGGKYREQIQKAGAKAERVLDGLGETEQDAADPGSPGTESAPRAS